MVDINGKRLLERIRELGNIGIDAEGRRTRLAASDADKQGRDLVVSWMKEAGLKVVVDYVGNIFGIWETPENCGEKPFMTGSHIDTVINAGQYDGCMVSGAGQDSQMMARLCPTAMIFSPSVNGISHNPKEYTKDEDVVKCANVFLDVVLELANK